MLKLTVLIICSLAKHNPEQFSEFSAQMTTALDPKLTEFAPIMERARTLPRGH